MNIREKWSMWRVSFFERKHHTNPSVTVYVRANGTYHAIREACDQCATLPSAHFETLTIETAGWKQEEELCTPWNKPELP